VQYIKFWILEGFPKWFEFTHSATNLLQGFDAIYQQKNKVHWIMEVANLWEKTSWWAKFQKIGLRKR
jgi:hypothetical protein